MPEPLDPIAFARAEGKSVLTFLGYSGAGYEDPAAMLRYAAAALDRFDPLATLVNSGATAAGIGAVYELARARGFSTMGIVSTQARESGEAISPFVDRVFYVEDETWGGFVAGTDRLSPTSAAMVDVSDHLVAIGGGEIARDELTVARRLGKRWHFIPADMNHRLALDRARERGLPPPTDFSGAAAHGHMSS